MIDRKELDEIDSLKMYKIYDDWPNISKSSYEKNLKKINFEPIDHIVFAGMGGSGTIGDVLASFLSKKNIHVNVVKGYSLPQTVDSNTLVVATSVSGNTKETLSVLKKTLEKKCKVISFSSGGEIEKFCKQNDITHIKISLIHSPRASLPNYLYTILNVIHDSLNLDEKEIQDSIIEMKKIAKIISLKNLKEDNIALNLAKWIKGIPMVYYPYGLEAVAIRFKNSVQENAKCHIITENVIEACHNGIVSWEQKSSVQPILLQGMDDHTKTTERWNIIKEFFEKMDIDYFEIKSISGNILSKIITLIYLLDYSSIYLATISGIDPSPIESVDFVKQRL